jgi:hypothetical protein
MAPAGYFGHYWQNTPWLQRRVARMHRRLFRFLKSFFDALYKILQRGITRWLAKNLLLCCLYSCCVTLAFCEDIVRNQLGQLKTKRFAVERFRGLSNA